MYYYECSACEARVLSARWSRRCGTCGERLADVGAARD
jgi:Zn finger protein HypA/HybF involved in hydrogenase expression